MFGSSEMQRAAWDAHQRDNRPDVVELPGEVRTARQVHACDCCRGSIAPGQRYCRDVVVVDGEVQVSKYHHAEADCSTRQRWR